MDSRSGSRQAEETQLTQITLQVGTIDEVRPTVPLIAGVVRAVPPEEGRAR